ncbi:MAG: hypothetical protein LIP23_04700 [Planctomycetes bacterium]|nr:hypothetical protein [Planctomycetota bacterium]
MEIVYLELPFTPNPPHILSRLKLDTDSDEAEDFLALLERTKTIARPKAAYGIGTVDEADEISGKVVISGMEFTSSLMAKNLLQVKTAWPYLATCGRELYDFVMAIPDPFERYWGEEIMEEALRMAMNGMVRDIKTKRYDGKTAVMSPGSLTEWPIQQQTPLFKLMGEAPERCGIELTDTFLMLPNKSVSGIRFANEHGYVNCRLCPKENCPNRQVAYDKELAEMM